MAECFLLAAVPSRKKSDTLVMIGYNPLLIFENSRMADPAPPNPTEAVPPPHKRRFQIHLSTCIVLMFVAGGLLWANTRYFWGNWLDTSPHFRAVACEYGWPWCAYYDNGCPDDNLSFLIHGVAAAPSTFFIWNFLGDLLVAASAVLCCALLFEFSARRWGFSARFSLCTLVIAALTLASAILVVVRYDPWTLEMTVYSMPNQSFRLFGFCRDQKRIATVSSVENGGRDDVFNSGKWLQMAQAWDIGTGQLIGTKWIPSLNDDEFVCASRGLLLPFVQTEYGEQEKSWLTVLEVETATPLARIPISGANAASFISEDAHYALIKHGDPPKWQSWDLQTRKALAFMDVLGSEPPSPSTIAAGRVAFGDGRVYDLITGKLIADCGLGRNVFRTYLSPDGLWAGVLLDSQTSEVWRIQSAPCLDKRLSDDLRGFLPEGRIWVGGKIFSIGDYQLLGTFNPLELSSCWSPDGRRMYDGLSGLFDVSTGLPLTRLFRASLLQRVLFPPAPQGPIIGAFDRGGGKPVFSMDGERLLVRSGNLDRDAVEVWHRRRPEYWWGVAWLPEFWLTVLFAGAFVWSVVNDRRRFRALAATARDAPVDGRKAG